MQTASRHLANLVALTGLLVIAGCGTQANPPSTTGGKSPGGKSGVEKSTAGNSSSDGAKQVELKILTADELFASIKKKTGKVVIVDCWSTWCEPCKKEFPHLLELQKKFGDKVACISVSLDVDPTSTPEECQENVLAFLKEKNSTIENVLSRTPDSEFFEAVKKELQLKEAPAGVPIVLLFNQEGKLAQRWDNTNLKGEGSFSYATVVEPEVEKLLKP